MPNRHHAFTLVNLTGYLEKVGTDNKRGEKITFFSFLLASVKADFWVFTVRGPGVGHPGRANGVYFIDRFSDWSSWREAVAGMAGLYFQGSRDSVLQRIL